MKGLAVALATVVIVGGAGCRTELPPPAARPLPRPDGKAPLLGAPTPRSSRIASYRIAATLDPLDKRIDGTASLLWRHTGVAPVTTLPFHLYMNAFKNDASLFMRESGGSHRLGVKSDGDWGWIDLTSIKLGAEELRPSGKPG